MASDTSRHTLRIEESIKRELEANPKNLEKYFQFLKLANTGKLAGKLSHTLNNILGGILGYAQLLKFELAQTSDGYRHAELIEKATKRATKLVSRLELGAEKSTSYENLIDPKIIVHQAVSLLGGAHKKSIQINTSYSHGKAKIHADASTLTQALLNICMNAVEAIPEGGELAISTKVIEEKQLVAFSVRDTGTGIKPEILPHIFQPFFSTKNQGLSCGMGLPLAEALVKSHRGTIKVDSGYGKGAEFTIFLPVAHPAVVNQNWLSQPIDNTDNGTEKLIMIIDDETELREMAKKIFEKKGFRVLLAENGEIAIQVFKENSHKIRLVILDMILPGVDGAQVYKKLKELCPGPKIILTSGYINNSEFQQIVEKGDELFLPKPWDIPELIDEAEKVLG